MSESTQLVLRLLGEIEVVRGGQQLLLPASRKARALLIYLAVTRQPHRRDRLCAMFWDLPDDPRGALRSSLSKLRPLVDTPVRKRILAERDSVRLDSADAEIDLFAVQSILRGRSDEVSTEELEQAAALFRGEFAEGLDLTNCPDFHAWCVAEREEARRMRARILRTLIERYGATPEAALVHGRMLARIEATDSSAHVALLRLLIASGRQREAEEQRQVSMRLLGEVGDNAAHEFAMAWRSLTARPTASHRVHGLSPATTSGEPVEPRPAEESARASAALESERQHIVVLPFINMSDDANQEYFADGITEDIITDLSQVSALFVVPRNTAFTYKDKAVEIAEVAQRLKVGYVLRGSVRKAANRVRVTVQLIDGATGDHLWSARYDRDLGDIFALQDDISKSVVCFHRNWSRLRAVRRRMPKPMSAIFGAVRLCSEASATSVP